MSGVLFEHLDAVLAVLGVEHLHVVLLEHAGQREDVADVVVDDEHLAAGQRRIVLVQLLEHLALLGRQVALDAVQEQRGLVEQPLRRLHVLDDDRLGQPPQLGLLLLRQLLAGVDDDRNLRQLRARLHLLEQLEAAHVARARGRAPGSRTRCCSSAASASAPVATAVVFTSPLPISSTMLWRSTSSSSTTSRFLTLRSMNPSIVREGAARAPRARPAWRGTPSRRAACRAAPPRASR